MKLIRKYVADTIFFVLMKRVIYLSITGTNPAEIVDIKIVIC